MIDSTGTADATVNRCEPHGYEGIPKCPFPDCVNGSGRDIFRTIKLKRNEDGNLLDAHDNYQIEAERIFVRVRDGRHSWIWREVVYLEPAP